MITTTPRRSRRLLLCGAIALTGLGMTSFTVADAAAPAAVPVRSAATSTDDTATSNDTASDDTEWADDTAADDTEWADEGATDDTEWADWISESNAEQDQLAAYLGDHGIAYTIQQDNDADGSPWRWVEVDYDNQAASDAVDDFYWSLYPVEQAEIDAENADSDALGAYLEAHSIAITTSTDRHGYHIVDWNYDDPAAEAVVEDYYWELYPTSAEDVAAINGEAEGEVAYLTANGFTAWIETDRHGIESSVFDESDDAIWTALDTYWSTLSVD